MAVKKKEHERLEDSNIDKVISLLDADKPISKKDACSMLNISYNTSRLAKITDGRKKQVVIDAELKAKFKNKKLTESDIKFIINEYIFNGEALSNIAKSLYRSPGIIKRALQNNDIPLRSTSTDYFHPELVPEGNLRAEYSIGDLVFSARYNEPAEIKSLMQNSKTHGNVYRIWLLKESQYAYQPSYELASLTHIQ